MPAVAPVLDSEAAEALLTGSSTVFDGCHLPYASSVPFGDTRVLPVVLLGGIAGTAGTRAGVFFQRLYAAESLSLCPSCRNPELVRHHCVRLVR